MRVISMVGDGCGLPAGQHYDRLKSLDREMEVALHHAAGIIAKSVEGANTTSALSGRPCKWRSW